MSRKRSITSDISTDPRVAQLAQYGPLPLLLYTWCMTHADDWGRLIGEPVQLRLTVCPALAVSAAEVEEALNQVAAVGLWERYQVDGRWYIAYPLEAWYRHQSYISKDKRSQDKSQFPPPSQRTSPQSATEWQRAAQSGAERQSVAVSVPSPSPSPEKDVVVEPVRAPVEITEAAASREITAGWAEVAPASSTVPAAIRHRLLNAAANGFDHALLRELAKRCASPQTRKSAPYLDQILSDCERLGNKTLTAFLASEARAAPEKPQFLNGFV